MPTQLVPNGRYILEVSPEAALTMETFNEKYICLRYSERAPQNPRQFWDVAASGDGYTLYSVMGGLFLGDKRDQTSPALRLEGVQQPFLWKIESSGEGTFTLSPSGSGGKMLLSQDPVPMPSPPVCWAPVDASFKQNWRLVKVA